MRNSQVLFLYAWQCFSATAHHEEFFIAAILNASLKSRFMQEFNRLSRILAGLVGSKISPLENKKRSKKLKTLKSVFF